jgi:RNA polymerase primary sigma factor
MTRGIFWCGSAEITEGRVEQTEERAMNHNDRKPLLGHSWDEAVKGGEDRVLTRDESEVMFSLGAGEPVSSLAKRLRCPEASVRRVTEQRRVRRIMELPLEYMPSPEFASRDAARTILRPLPESARPRRTARPPAGLPSYIASLYEVPLLTPEQETYLFRKYNYLKFRAARLRHRLDAQRPAKRIMEEIESLYDQAVATKNQIIRANLRLVISVAKRYVTDEQQLCDLVSDGNESLMRAVEKFDYTRGFKFSTYAVWALKRNCVRSYAKEMKYRDRFRAGPEDLFDEAPEERTNLREQLGAQQRREAEVGRILHELPDRERQIILSRFGLTPGQEPKTLQEVAHEIGVSKERIRQLERRALGMLRKVASEQNLQFADMVSAAS